MENFVVDRQESVGRDIESISDFFLRNWSLKFSEGDTSVEKEYETLKSEKAKTTSKTSKVVFRMQEIRVRTREKDVASQIKLTQSVG